MNALVDKIGLRTSEGDNVADGVVLLMKRAFEHGHTEEVRVISPNGKTRVITMPKRELIGRLAQAAERGVFARRSAEAIVERILSTEAPAAAAPSVKEEGRDG